MQHTESCNGREAKEKRHKAYRKNGRMANINPTLSIIKYICK